MQDKLEILKTVVDACGIRFAILESPYEGIGQFDEGLRGQLYQNYDFNSIIRQLEESCQDNKLYLVRDVFELYYIIFQMQNPENGCRQYVMIGPYLEESNEPDPLEIVEKLGLELYHVQILKTFYSGIGVMVHFENIIVSLMNSLYPEKVQEIAHTGLTFWEQQKGMQMRIREENRLPMEVVEERYRCENLLLEAVERGNVTEALLSLAAMSKYSAEKRNADSLRNDKNSLIIFNVLLRKAVEKAGVHPYYIDELSSSFARRIEAARNMRDIVQINREIVRKYCLLVQNYAAHDYSDLVEKAVNYIEFNLMEDLRLSELAEQFNVNASYLSIKFKKEVGQNITDYINEKRVASSLPLLATTRLPIGEVAEKVGILDENYYSRLFKRLRGMTPREYRKRMLDGK